MEDTSEDDLISVVQQIIRRAPLSSLSDLLTNLCCFYARDENNFIDISIIKKIQENAIKSVCGVVFKKGDIVWTCRQCAKDQTCVQCDPCFKRSNHEGHEVYFHRAAGGSGCCDCGDPEAWHKSGNCLDHSHESTRNDDKKTDPISKLPPNVVKGLQSVLKAGFSLVMSCITMNVRGFNEWSDNEFAQQICKTDNNETVMTVRVHNDDIHTYDQVTKAFQDYGIGPEAAKILTKQVDTQGDATILSDSKSSSQVLKLWQIFHNSVGLRVSIVPSSVVKMEPSLVCFLNWMIELGMKNESFQRVIVNELLANASILPDIHPLVGSEDIQYHPKNLFESSNQFPNLIPYLSNAPILACELQEPTLLDRATLLPSTVSLSSTAATPATVSPAANGAEFRNLMMRPFEYCDRNCYAMMVMASPFLSKGLKKAINEIIINFQHDFHFKMGFSQIITTLYASLYLLYSRFVGTVENTILLTTVQVYTSNSVLSMTSSDGIFFRSLPERSRSVMIMKQLVSTLLVVLRDVGAKYRREVTSLPTVSQQEAFLKHEAIIKNRIDQLCRDLEYISIDSAYSARMLANDVDYGTVEDWLEICTLLQNLNRYVFAVTSFLGHLYSPHAMDGLVVYYRQTRELVVHVSTEGEEWQYAANLIIELENVSNTFVSKGLCDQPTTKPTEQFNYGSYLGDGDESMQQTNPVVNYAKTITYQLKSDPVAMHTEKVKAVVTSVRKGLEKLLQWEFDGRDVSSIRVDIDTFELLHGMVSLPMWTNHYKTFKSSSANPVSVHIPLHHFITKIIRFAAFGNVNLSTVLANHRAPIAWKKNQLISETVLPGSRLLQSFCFADYPLRALSFMAQVQCQMWIRNGSPVANIAFNYSRIPLCRLLRDVDVSACQISILWMNPDEFLALAIHRFEVAELLEYYEYYVSGGKALTSDSATVRPDGAKYAMEVVNSDTIKEYKGPLLSELFKLLIMILVQLPVSLSASEEDPERPTEGYRRALSREIVHQVLIGQQTVGQLHKVRAVVGNGKSISDAIFQSAIQDVCLKRDTAAVAPDTLLDASLSVTTTPSDGAGSVSPLQLGMESTLGSNHNNTPSDHASTVSNNQGPTANTNSSSRQPVDENPTNSLSLKPDGFILYDPEYPSLNVQQSVVAADRIRFKLKAALDEQKKSKAVSAYEFVPLFRPNALPLPHAEFHLVRSMMYRPMFIQLMGRALQICLKKAPDSDTSGSTAPAPHILGSSKMSIVEKVIYLVTLQLTCLDSIVLQKVGTEFVRSLGDHSIITQAGEGSEWTSSNTFLTDAFAMPAMDIMGTPVGYGRVLLLSLADIWIDGWTKDDVLYNQGLGWILKEISTRSVQGAELLRSKGIVFDNGLSAEQEKAERKKKQLEAQKRALNAINKNASMFASMAMEDDEDDEETDGEKEQMSSEGCVGKDRVWLKYSSYEVSEMVNYLTNEPECVICKEKKDSVLGYMCYIQQSNLLSNYLTMHQDLQDLNSVYRVVSLKGCMVYQLQSKQSPVVNLLPQGTHLLAAERHGLWVRLVAPCEGWCTFYEFVSNQDNATSTAKPSTGFRNQAQGKILPNLFAVNKLEFVKHGRSRYHVTKCGHAMHTDCWDEFLVSNFAKRATGMNSLRGNISIDIERNESFCPLCKSITNNLIPYCPKPHEADSDAVPILPVLSPSPSNESITHSTNVLELTQSIESSLCNPLSSSEDANLDGVTFFTNSLTYTNNTSFLGQSAGKRKNRDSYEDLYPMLKHRHSCPFQTMRGVHLIVTTAAYTLQTATLRHLQERDGKLLNGLHSPGGGRETTSSTTEQPGMTVTERSVLDGLILNHRDYSMFCHLLCILRKIQIWFDTEAQYEAFVKRPVVNMLTRGEWPNLPTQSTMRMANGGGETVVPLIQTTTCSADQVRVALASLPYESAESNLFPNSRAIALMIEYAASTQHHFPHEVLWGYLNMPLLDHDLHGIAMVTLSCATDLSAAFNLQSIVCWARLVQIVLEPLPNENAFDEEGRLLSLDSESSSHEMLKMAREMLKFRNEMRQLCGMVPSSEEVSLGLPLHIMDIVMDSWIPFLEFSYHCRFGAVAVSKSYHVESGDMEYNEEDHEPVLDLPMIPSNHPAMIQLVSRYRYLRVLMKILKMPSLDSVLLDGSGMKSLMKVWVAQYFNFHTKLSLDGMKTLSSNDVSTAFIPHNYVSREKLIENSSSNMESMTSITTSSSSINSGSKKIKIDPQDDRYNEMLRKLRSVGIESVVLERLVALVKDNLTADANWFDQSDKDDMLESQILQSLVEYLTSNDGLHAHESVSKDELIQEQIEEFIRSGGLMKINSQLSSTFWTLYGVDPSNRLVDEHPPELFQYAYPESQRTSSAVIARNSSIVDRLSHFHATAPFVSTVTGSFPILGLNGEWMGHGYPDLSHMGVGLRHLKHVEGGLIELPYSYTDLYNKVKFPFGSKEITVDDPVICLLCGRVLSAGNRAKKDQAETDYNAGECTIHARECGSDIGIFFMVQHCTVILMRGSRACYSPSLYLDSMGELPENRGQNRPLYLSRSQYKKLQDLYWSHLVAREVTRKRSNEDRIIRQNWY